MYMWTVTMRAKASMATQGQENTIQVGIIAPTSRDAAFIAELRHSKREYSVFEYVVVDVKYHGQVKENVCEGDYR